MASKSEKKLAGKALSTQGQDSGGIRVAQLANREELPTQAARKGVIDKREHEEENLPVAAEANDAPQPSDLAVEASSQPMLMAQALSPSGNDLVGSEPAKESKGSEGDYKAALWWLGGMSLLGGGLSMVVSNNSGSGNSGNVVFTGKVTDGPVEGATIYRDVNGNGIFDAATDVVMKHNGVAIKTDANGNFKITEGDLVENGIGSLTNLKLVSHGGIDTVSNEAVTVDFSAPAGYLQLNPVTSLIAAVMDANPGMTAAQAELKVEEALGLPNLDYATADLSKPEAPLDAQQTAAILATTAILANQSGAAADSDAFQYIAENLGNAGNTDAVVAQLRDDLVQAGDYAAAEQLDDTVAAIEFATDTDTIGEALNNTFFADLTVSGEMLVGQTVSGGLGLGSTTDLDVTYQWQESADGTTWVDIEGATESTYTITANESGDHLRLVAHYTGNDGVEHTVTGALPGTVAASNHAPTISSAATAAIAENAATSTVVYTAEAADVDANDTRTFAIGGTDANFFNINTATGVVTLKASADFETKSSYSIEVTVTDAGGLSDTKAVTVNVTNVNEAPVITSGSTATVAENAATSTVLYHATATDVDANDGKTFTLSGADANLFNINAAGELTFKSSPDFEAPADSNADNVYDVRITVTDTAGLTDVQDVAVSVTDVDERTYVEIYHNPSDPADAHMLAETDDGVTAVTVISSIQDAVTLDVTPASGAVVDLCDAAVTAMASADMSSAALDIEHASGTISGLTVVATGADAAVDAVINSDGDLTIGAIRVEVTSGSGETEVLRSGLYEKTSFFSSDASLSGDIYCINDGNNDQYDDGNYINSDFSGSSDIAYAFAAPAADAFGAGSEHIMVVQDAVWGMMVTGNLSDTFDVSGNLGADGTGFEDLQVIADGYNGYYAIVQRTQSIGYGETDVNRVFIYKADSAVVTAAPLDGDTDSDDFHLSGLSAVDTFAYFVLLGDNTDTPLPLTELEAFFHNVVDNVMHDADAADRTSVADMSSAFLSSYDTLVEPFEGLVTVNQGDYSSANLALSGSVTLDDFITVTAAAHASSSSFSAGLASGDVTIADNPDGGITVTASGDNSSVDVNIYNATGVISSITVEASGVSADADVYIGGDVAIGDVTVTTSGASGDANIDLYGVTFADSSINVSAASYDADAHFDTWGGSGAISGISVTAGYDAYASARISGDITMGGDVLLEAAGVSSSAYMGIGWSNDSTVVFDDAAITVTADGGFSRAELDVENVTGSIASLTVSGMSFDYITASITVPTGDVTIGDVTLNASGEQSEVVVSLGGVSFDDSAVSVNSDSSYAEAGIKITSAVGSIASLTADAADSQSSVHAGISAHSGDLVSLGDTTVTASGMYASADVHLSGVNFVSAEISVVSGSFDTTASLDVHAATGAIDGITVETGASADYAQAHVVFHNSSDVTAGGFISVTAADGSSDASLYFSYDSTVAFDDAAVTVTASGYSSEAGLTAYNASGTVGSLTVEASEEWADASVYIESDGTLEIGDISVTASGNTDYWGTAAVASMDVIGDVTISGNVTVTASGTSAEAQLNAYNDTVTFDDGGLGSNTATVTASGNCSYAEIDFAAAGAISSLTVEASGHNAQVYAYMDIASGDSLLIDTVTVTATGDSNDYAHVEFSGAGDVELGDISVTADYWEAHAYLNNNNASGSIIFNSSDITVTATGEGSLACFDVEDAIGDISSLTVEASGDYASAEVDISSSSVTINGAVAVTASSFDAYSNIRFRASSDVTITGGLTVEASSNDAEASVYFYESSDVTIGGDITVTASGVCSEAIVDFNAFGDGDNSVTFDNESVSVTASGSSSDAILNAVNASGAIGGLTVEASGNCADANADISGDVTVGNITLTASGGDSLAAVDLNGVSLDSSAISVSADGYYSDASLDISAATGTISSISVQANYSYDQAEFYLYNSSDVAAGDITIAASGASSEAHVWLGYNTSDATTVALDASTISVTAGCNDSDAGLLITDATGSISSLTVEASGYSAYASADISGNVTIGDVTVTASGDYSMVDVDLNGASFDSSAISITATGSDVSADFIADSASGTISSLTVESSGYSSHVNANISGDVSISGNVDITVANEYSEVDMNLVDVTYNDSSINISAMSNDSYAYFYTWGGSGTINGISLTTGISADGTTHISAEGSYIDASISGDITISGNVVAEAAGDCSDVFLTIGSNDSTAFDDATITVTASGNSSEAWLDAYNASGTIGSLTVEASGESADAGAHIESDGTLEIGAINVEASGNSPVFWDVTSAKVEVSGDVTLSGSISVTASGRSAEASFTTNTKDAVIFADVTGDISVTASSEDAYAHLEVYNASGTIGGLTVEATGYNAAADASISGDITIGNITLAASGNSSSADVDLNGVNFYSSAISVSADGYDSFASLDVSVATGAISSISVQANYSNDQAAFYLHGSSDVAAGDITIAASGESSVAHVWLGYETSDVTTVSLDASTISVTASGSTSDAGLLITDATGNISSLKVEASGYDADASADISGNFTIGDATVTASADYALAEVNLNGVSFDSSAIAVSAVSGSSDALFDAYNATGTINGIAVTAGGTSRHEIQGFDYFGSYISSDFVEGAVISLTVDGVTLSHTLTSEDIATGYDNDLQTILADFTQQAAVADLAVSFSSYDVFGPGLWINFGDTADHDMSVLSIFGNTDIQNIEFDGTQGQYANADAVFSAGSEIMVSGPVDVTATAGSSDALLRFSGDSSVVLDDVAISVKASGYDSTAELQAYNASGSISSVTVEASGESSEATVLISSDVTTADVTIGGLLSVTASGQSSKASFSMDISADVTFNDTAITVTASGVESDADLYVYNGNGSGTTGGTIAGISVTASGSYASADAYIYGAVSVSGDIVVNTSGTGGSACLDLCQTIFDNASVTVSAVSNGAAVDFDTWGGSGTINGISVTAGVSADGSPVPANYASASAMISGDIIVSGDILVEAAGIYSDANLTMGCRDVSEFDAATITVAASGYRSEVSADIYNAGGTVSSLTVEASGSCADVDVSIDGDVAIGDIDVATSGASGDADLYLYGVTFADSSINVSAVSYDADAYFYTSGGSGAISGISVTTGISADGSHVSAEDAYASARISGDITIGGNVLVEASGACSDAYLTIGSYDSTAFDDAAITVTASGYSSEAWLSAYNASGTISSLTVEASGNSSEAGAYIESDGTLEIGAINIEASGSSPNSYDVTTASVDIHGDVTLGDFISVTASGTSAEASFSVDSTAAVIFTDNVGGGISVTASGESSEAWLNAYNASGTISDITVTASSRSADAHLVIEGDGAHTLTIGDNIALLASGYDSHAAITLGSYDITAGPVFSGTDVKLEATGIGSSASIDISNATGTIDTLVVSAKTGMASQIYADIDSESATAALNIGSTLTVTASAEDSAAGLSLYGNAGDGQEFSISLLREAAGGTQFAAGVYTLTVGTQVVHYDLAADTSNIDDICMSLYFALDAFYPDADFSLYSSGDNIVIEWNDRLTHTEEMNINGIDAVLYSPLEAAHLVTFNNTAITVTASGDSSDAGLYIDGATGTITNITVLDSANGGESYDQAYAEINGDITITGAITVTASGDDDMNRNDSADAALYLNADYGSGTVNMSTVTLSVAASGYSTEASAEIFNAYGTLDSITVTASGESAYAAASFSHDAEGATLDIGNIDVAASGENSGASLYLAGFEGRHAQTELSLTVDVDGHLAAGSYTLEINGNSVSLEILPGTHAETAFQSLLDRYEAVYGSSPVSLDHVSGGNNVYCEWQDYADHAGNMISITPPASAEVFGVVTQVAQDQTFIDMNNSVINVSADASYAGAYLAIHQATGNINEIIVSSSGYSSDANADIEGVFSINNITVESNGGAAELNLGSGSSYDHSPAVTMNGTAINISAVNYGHTQFSADNVTGTIAALNIVDAGISSDVSVDISGNFTLTQDTALHIHASGEDSNVDVALYGTRAQTDLGDHNVTLTNSISIEVESTGYNSDTELYLADAKGTIGAIDIIADNGSADAYAEIDFTGNLNGDITVNAAGEGADAGLDMSAGIRSYTEVRWEGLWLWNSGTYSYDIDNPDTQAFLAGETYTLTVGEGVDKVELSYTMQAGDITGDDYTNVNNLIAGWKGTAEYAAAGFEIVHDGANDPTRYFNILWDDATTVHNQDLISMTVTGGSHYGTDIENLLYQGLGSDPFFASDGVAVTLAAGTDVSVSASGSGSDAWTNLDNLSGPMDTLTVSATGVAASDTFNHEGSVADAVVRFDAGGVTAVNLNAAYADDEVYAAISQHVKSGTVTVTGDGHATLLFDDKTAGNINLSGLHDDAWGVFNLELSMADANYSNDVDGTAALNAGMITIASFDTTRDSINISTPYDDRTNEWANDNGHGVYEVDYSEGAGTVASYAAFLADAHAALDADTSDNPGYYFATDGTDGYLAYDRGGEGITGVITLLGVTEFDRVNVADRFSMDLSGYVGTLNPIWLDGAVTSLEYNTYYHSGDRVGSMEFTDQVHLEGLHISADSGQTPDASTSLTLTEDGVNGDLIFRQVDISVYAESREHSEAAGAHTDSPADATLAVTGASGTIEHLAVDAIGSYGDTGTSTATFTGFNGAVHEIEVGAEYAAGSHLTIGGITESVDHLWMSSRSVADTTADITLVDGYIVKTDVDLDAYVWTDSGDVVHTETASATLEVTQVDHGGDVYATSTIISGDGTAPAAGTAVFDLTYNQATAENINLGHAFSGDAFVAGDFDGTFHLALNGIDVDTAFNPANIIHIYGWDSGTALAAADTTRDDTIAFDNIGGYAEDEVDVNATIADFLTDADTALDGTTADYYFGIVGEDGYLAYDQDGTGITQVIEFVGITQFDATRIHEPIV